MVCCCHPVVFKRPEDGAQFGSRADPWSPLCGGHNVHMLARDLLLEQADAELDGGMDIPFQC